MTKSEYGMFDELAARLAKAGFASYRFDFSGLGESEGDFVSKSLTTHCDDLRSILEFVGSQNYVNTNNIGIHAQSFGTAITIACIPDVKAIVLTGSFTNLAEVFIKHFGSGYNPDGISEHFSESTQKLKKVGPQFWKDFGNYNLTESIRQIHAPILFITGEKDTSTPLPEMEELFAAANEPKKKIILKGAEHSLRPKREEMYKLAAKWFKKTS